MKWMLIVVVAAFGAKGDHGEVEILNTSRRTLFFTQKRCNEVARKLDTNEPITFTASWGNKADGQSGREWGVGVLVTRHKCVPVGLIR